MTASSGPAAASPAAPWSTLSPNAAPFNLRARPVCAPPGLQKDGDASMLIDAYLVLPEAYDGVTFDDAVYPASTHGMHWSQPSSSSGTHVKEYPSSASSTSGYTWMTSGWNGEQHPLTSGEGRSGNKSTMVTIKCPPNRTLQTNNIDCGSKGKLAIEESVGCNNEAGKDISFCKNLEFSNPSNDNGCSPATLELSPVLKPLCIPSTRASSHVSAADDVNPDPSECSVDSPCWPGTLANMSALYIRQTSDGWSAKQKSVDFDAGKGNPVQDCGTSTEIENLVSTKTKQNRSQPHFESGLSRKSEDIDTNLKNDCHAKKLEHAEPGAGQCNAEPILRSEVRNNFVKRSVLNSSAPYFIPSSVQKSSSGSGMPSSIISHGSCSSTGRNISEILKEIKSQSDLLHSYSDDIKLEEQDLSLLQSAIETLQSSLYKARKGLVKVASYKAGLKACHSQNAVSKSVAVNQNDIYTVDNENRTIISTIADSTHSPGDFGRNNFTGYQPAPGNFQKESSYEDEHPQVRIFKKLWINAERTNCALKYQLEQTRMAIDLESSMAQNGDGPKNPSFQLCDMVTDPSSSVGLALTCPPMFKDYPGARKTTNIIYAGNGIHSGDNNVLSRSKDCVLKNIHGEHFMSDLEESSIRCRLSLVPNKSHGGWNSSISDGVLSHSSITTRRDDILPASCEFGLLDWEHVRKDEIA